MPERIGGDACSRSDECSAIKVCVWYVFYSPLGAYFCRPVLELVLVGASLASCAGHVELRLDGVVLPAATCLVVLLINRSWCFVDDGVTTICVTWSRSRCYYSFRPRLTVNLSLYLSLSLSVRRLSYRSWAVRAGHKRDEVRASNRFF
ncbi:unnamed protein product [Hapterophycus canaliculatus]